jgi:hypothetical protein
MNRLDLNSNDDPASANSKPAGFWKRQFQREPTRKQRIFDWAYGVIIPTICVAADPIVFRSSVGLPPSPGFSEYKAFAYVLSAASILAMAAWLLWGKKLGRVTALMAGLFIFGSGISLTVGVLILPISLIASLVGIGLLGLTPLFSGIVFLRNGVRAHSSSLRMIGGRMTLGLASLGALYSFVVPYVIYAEVDSRVEVIANGNVDTIRRETAILKRVSFLVHPAPIARRYRLDSPYENTESQRMKELAISYEELTGEKVSEATVGWD